MWNGTAKIIEAIATVKADTKNYKEDIKDLKDTFEKHIDREDKQSQACHVKIEAIHLKLEKFVCPHHEDMKKIERRVHDNQKVAESRRITDIEERSKAKALEVKARADKDEDIAKKISSLQTSKKYAWMTQSGIYIVLCVILKKIFTS